MSHHSSHARAKELVFQASRLPRDQRAAYLDSLVDGDAALRAEVRSVLDWSDEGEDLSVVPPADFDLAEGTLLEGRYRIAAKLGQGGSGAVYRAHDELLDLPVAIKRSNSSSPKLRERLRREAILARSIQHPNVRRIHEVFVSNDELHLVMGLAEGRDLGARLRDVGVLDAREVAVFALEIASGLAAVHEAGAVHGDLKPENILTGATGAALITDFGIAHQSNGGTARVPAGGTPRYLSPERRAGALASPSGDVYALALLLRDLLVGRSDEAEDVEGQSLGVDALVPEVDPRLATAISRGLLPEPARPAHAGEFLELLHGRSGAHARKNSAVRRPVTALWCELRASDVGVSLDILDTRQLAIEVCQSHGGTPIAASSAAGLLVLFGVFESSDRQDTRAVRAALEIVARSSAQGAVPPRIAIDTRVVEVLVDEAGAPILDDGFDQLREIAHPIAGSIVVGDATGASIRERFALRPLGAAGYEVLFEIRPKSINLALRESGARAVGREAEKQKILARWEDVQRTRRGSVVVVHGGPGMGKSRLIGEVGLALGEKHRWVEVNCPDERTSPLEPWRWVIEQVSAEAIPAYGLAEFLLGEDAAIMEPRLRQACVIDEIGRRLAEASRRGPMVLVFEDLHWCDAASLQVLTRVAAEAGELALLLIVSWRSDSAPIEIARGWERVALEPLDASAAGSMLADLLGEVDARSQELIGRSGGVPLFLEQLARAVRDGASLDQIPSSLRALLSANLDRLGKSAEVARAAAVIGREFDAALLARVMRRERAELERDLQDLAVEGLIEPAPSQADGIFQFGHSLQHQSAYESIPVSSCRSLHEACLVALDVGDPDASIDRSRELARHCEKAGREQDAIAWWVDAAERAARAMANAAAVDYFQRALALCPDVGREFEIRLAMLQAQQATLSFSLSETADNAERVLELLKGASISALSKPHLFLGRTYLARTDLRLKELGERLDPLAESSQDPYLRAAWFVQRGNCELMLGNLVAARAWYLRGWEGLDRAVREGLRPEPPDSRVFALSGLALLEALRCRPETHVYIERALSAAREAGDPGSRIFALEYAALAFLSTRDVERALPLLEEGELLARSYQMDVWVNQAALFRACADAQTGDADRSATELPRILAAGRAMHFNLFDGFGLSHLALAEERRGNWAAAREAVERGLQLASTTLDRLWIAEMRRQHAVQRARAGETGAEVAAEYERAIQLAQGQDAVTLELRARTSAVAWYPEPAAHARARAELAALVARPGLDPGSRDLREARALVASDDRREGDPAG